MKDRAHLMFLSFIFGLSPKFCRMSFGWYRAEVLGAIVSVLMIWVITAILVYWAIVRCLTGEFEVDAGIMLITSATAILVNIL